MVFIFLVGFNLISIGVTLSPQLPSTINKTIILKGKASWYSCKDKGIHRTTANMEIFDDTKLTCAMWNLPFDTYLKVTNIDNGRYVIVRINDRGPSKHLVKKGRIIDLTKEAFCRIAKPEEGLINVEITILNLST